MCTFQNKAKARKCQQCDHKKGDVLPQVEEKVRMGDD